MGRYVVTGRPIPPLDVHISGHGDESVGAEIERSFDKETEAALISAGAIAKLASQKTESTSKESAKEKDTVTDQPKSHRS